MKFIILSLLLSMSAQASTLQDTLKKYQKPVKLTVEYKTHSTILNESQDQKGVIHLKTPNFNWTFSSPKDKTIYFNGKELTFVENIENQIVVVKRKTNGQNLVWFKLFNNPNQVKVIKNTPPHYQIKIDKYQLDLTIKNGEIKELTYFDEVDSRITLIINKTEWVNKISTPFTYTPKGSDVVSEL